MLIFSTLLEKYVFGRIHRFTSKKKIMIRRFISVVNIFTYFVFNPKVGPEHLA